MKMMSELGRYAPNKIFISLLLGGIAGICYVGLIPLVLTVMEESSALEYEAADNYIFLGLEIKHSMGALLFFTLCALILIMRTMSQAILANASISLTTEIRKNLYHKISSCPIDALEKIGSSKIITIMTRDIGMIVAGASSAPAIFINLIVIIGMLLYIYIVNTAVFSFVMISLLIGMASYQAPLLLAKKYYSKTNQLMEHLQESFRGIVHGAKELKLNGAKRADFINNELLHIEDNIRSTNQKAETLAITVINYGDMISFFVIGFLGFIFSNYFQISTQQLVAIIMILLYISGPVGAVLALAPSLIRANISYERLNNLFLDMATEEIHTEEVNIEDWDQLTLKEVNYSYMQSDGFKVGPINLTVKKGEITFIIGGNGSGKSTLSKLITQHYLPDSGDIFFGNSIVDKHNINAYRNCIASIYSDYFLFTSLHGTTMDAESLKKEVDSYLMEFGLSEKVTFENKKFSTLKLSDGQRRRLALIVAILEDKELYLFDEWAADQDPTFRDIFYNKILPNLKIKGKAVIAISHDDRYFDVADRLVKLDSGVLVAT